VQVIDAIGRVVEPLLLFMLLVVAGCWAVALVLTWLPTFRSWCFRIGFFGPGREPMKQLARYDRVCRGCAYPIDGEDRCPECGVITSSRNTIRPAELSAWAWRHPPRWLCHATVITLLASVSFFGGREAKNLGNRIQWGAALPQRADMLLLHAPVLSWAYARSVELPIGPDYRVYFQGSFVTDWDFAASHHEKRPRIGEVLCWIAPPPVIPEPTAAEVQRLTSAMGVEPEQYPAMARTTSRVPHQNVTAYRDGIVAVRIDVDGESWSTIGNGHPGKTGVGARSALEALYQHAGLLDAWHGSEAEFAAMAERLDHHVTGGDVRGFTMRETPGSDIGVTCINTASTWAEIPVHRQQVGLVLFGLVQFVVITLAIAYRKLQVAERRRLLADRSRPATG